MIRILRVDRKRERAAREDPRIDRSPRDACVASPEEAAVSVGVVCPPLDRRQKGERCQRDGMAAKSPALAAGAKRGKETTGPGPPSADPEPRLRPTKLWDGWVSAAVGRRHALAQGVRSGFAGTCDGSPLASVSSAAREQLPFGMFHQLDVIG